MSTVSQFSNNMNPTPQDLFVSGLKSTNKRDIEIGVPRVDPKEEKLEKEEITVFYDVKDKAKEEISSTAGYSYYATVD